MNRHPTVPTAEQAALRDYVFEQPARLFDAIAVSSNIPSKWEESLQLIGRPGERLVRPVQNGDLIIKRVLGEGNLAEAFEVANQQDLLTSTLATDKYLPPDMMVLKINNLPEINDVFTSEENQLNDVDNPVALLAFAGEIIAGAELGLGVFDRLNEHVFNGDFHVSSQNASYIHNPSPTSLVTHTRQFKFGISAHHPRYGIGTQHFYFILTVEYDGFNIRRASIVEDRTRSSTLIASDFRINFSPAAYSANNEPVAVIVYNISGSWDPIGRGEEAFTGSIIFDAQGALRRYRIQSPNTWVRKLSRVTKIGGGAVPRPTTERKTHNVFFDRPGSARLTERNIREISEWYNRLPEILRRAIHSGKIPVSITGHASSTGSVQSNQQLARRRVDSVSAIITDLAGSAVNLRKAAHGELDVQTGDNRETQQDRRVNIEITYEVYRLRSTGG